MDKPKLLDLFCGAGGASMGYHRAGFEVVGVDINPQKNYPFEFHQADAMTFPLDGFDAIHASPPCQHYAYITPKNKRDEYPDLIAPTRARLLASGLPFIIENVEGAAKEMPDAVRLCGSAFGLDVRRHRYFDSNVMLFAPDCCHKLQEPRFISLDKRKRRQKQPLATVVGVHGSLNYSGELALRRSAMGIDWMTNKEITQAIPPAYTEYLGRQLMTYVEADLASLADVASDAHIFSDASIKAALS